MTIKRLILLTSRVLIALSSAVGLYGQDPGEQCLLSLENMDYNSALEWAQEIKSPELKALALHLTKHYVHDNQVLDPDKFDIVPEATPKEQITYQILLSALMNATLNPKFDKQIITKLFEQRLRSDSINSYLLSKISLRRFTINSIYKNDAISELRQGLCDFEAYTDRNNTGDMFWLAYLKTGVEYREAYELIKDSLLSKNSLPGYKPEFFLEEFEIMHNNAANPMQCAFYYQSLGSYQASWHENYKAANTSFYNARYFYGKLNHAQARYRDGIPIFGLAQNLKNQGEFVKAIPLFIEDLKRKKVVKQKVNHLQALATCYDSVSRPKLAKEVRTLLKRLDEEGLTAKNDRLILEMRTNHLAREFNKEKEELKDENKELTKKNQSLFTNLSILLPTTAGIIILLILSYYWYRRYKKRSKKLEQEKSKTLEKLDQIEEAVTTKYIILNDKTKVYIGNVTYIKVEDHYLYIHYWEQVKPIETRGTLSEIREKLPPNFIQCHRAYIVNNNYVIQTPIKQSIRLKDGTLIPVSRSNKNKFKK